MTVSQFQGGQSNPTYLVATADRAFVLRKRPPGNLLTSAHAVEREFRVLSALAESGVPVPQVFHLCQDENVIGRAFYVMEFLDDRLVRSSSAERTAIYDSMNAALASLHSVDFRLVGLEDFGPSSGYIPRQISRWSKQYASSRIEDCSEMTSLMKWLNEHVPEQDECRIVHGDFRLGNLLFHPTQPIVVGILDWELSTLGHPLADLAYNCQMYRLSEPEGGVGSVAPGIPAEQEYVEAYCRRVGRDLPGDWGFYLAFSFFRSAAILAGVYHRGLAGNAADAAAVQRGRAYSQFARVGWDIARRLG